MCLLKEEQTGSSDAVYCVYSWGAEVAVRGIIFIIMRGGLEIYKNMRCCDRVDAGRMTR